MKKMMSLFFVVIFVFTMVTGCCTTLHQGQLVPQGCENSVVYKTVPYADLMGGVIAVIGFEAYKNAVVKKGLDPTPFVKAVENVIIALDNPSLTYPQFVVAMAQTNEQLMKHAGLEIVFLASLLDTMSNQNMVIDACDKAYFIRQLDNILMLMKMVK